MCASYLLLLVFRFGFFVFCGAARLVIGLWIKGPRHAVIAHKLFDDADGNGEADEGGDWMTRRWHADQLAFAVIERAAGIPAIDAAGELDHRQLFIVGPRKLKGPVHV